MESMFITLLAMFLLVDFFFLPSLENDILLQTYLLGIKHLADFDVYFYLSFGCVYEFDYFFAPNVSGPESFRAPTNGSVHNQSERDLPPDQLRSLYQVSLSATFGGKVDGSAGLANLGFDLGFYLMNIGQCVLQGFGTIISCQVLFYSVPQFLSGILVINTFNKK